MSFFKKNIETSERANKDIFELQHIKNQFPAQPCFLIGNGPSLLTSDLRAIEASPFPSMALNNSFTKINPEMWIGIDKPTAFHPSLFESSFIKITQWPLKDCKVKGRRLCDWENFYFFHVAADEGGSFAGDNVTFVFEGNTFSTALHMLTWMGFETICLVGCDFGGGEGLLYKDDTTKMCKKKNWGYLETALDFLKFAHEKGRKFGRHTKYISCSPNSRANSFLPYLPINRVLEEYSFAASHKVRQS